HQDGHRADERKDVHVQGGGGERGRDGRPVGGVEGGDARGAAGRAGRRGGGAGDRGSGAGGRHVDAVVGRWVRDHRLLGDAVHRCGGSAGGGVERAGHVEGDLEPGERHRVHVQGGGGERGRDGCPVGGVERGDACGGPGRADRRSGGA